MCINIGRNRSLIQCVENCWLETYQNLCLMFQIYFSTFQLLVTAENLNIYFVYAHNSGSKKVSLTTLFLLGSRESRLSVFQFGHRCIVSCERPKRRQPSIAQHDQSSVDSLRVNTENRVLVIKKSIHSRKKKIWLITFVRILWRVQIGNIKIIACAGLKIDCETSGFIFWEHLKYPQHKK